MPKHLSPDDVMEILRSGDFNQLLGTLEDHQVECKEAPYPLGEESGKFELAKDVSGMANVSGGVILIGVRTRRDPTLLGDVVRDVSPFAETQVNIKQYLDVLRDWSYPPLNTVDIRWWRSAADGTAGIVAIVVSPETSANAPHLVTKAALPHPGQTRGTLFGHFERLRADVQPTSVQALRDRFKDGRRFQELDQRYHNLEGLLGQMLKPSWPQYRPDMEPRHRIRGAMAAVELEGKARLTLAAIPEKALELPGLIESRVSHVVRLLDDPPRLVEEGFNLGTREPSQLLRGQARRSVVRGYKLLELWRDGLLIFAAAGDEEFLCWQMQSKHRTDLTINTLVLTEAVYLFAKLACEVYKESATVAGKVSFQAILSATQNMRYVLSPCPVGSPWAGLEQYHAPSRGDGWTIELDQQAATPEQVSFALLKEIYAWFGVEADRIPYVDRSGPEPLVTPEMIRPGRQ